MSVPGTRRSAGSGLPLEGFTPPAAALAAADSQRPHLRNTVALLLRQTARPLVGPSGASGGGSSRELGQAGSKRTDAPRQASLGDCHRGRGTGLSLCTGGPRRFRHQGPVSWQTVLPGTEAAGRRWRSGGSRTEASPLACCSPPAVRPRFLAGRRRYRSPACGGDPCLHLPPHFS